jgi:hypothetical protein
VAEPDSGQTYSSSQRRFHYFCLINRITPIFSSFIGVISCLFHVRQLRRYISVLACRARFTRSQ